MSIFESNSFKHCGYVVVPHEKSIKIVEHVEEFEGHIVFYMTDRTSYGINQLSSLESTLENQLK